MRLFIPDIGEELKLADDWRFATKAEDRNATLFDAYEVPPQARFHPLAANARYDWHRDGLDHYKPKTCDGFVMPKGTILKVDRVYIRKGNEDFSSITFIVVDSPDKRVITKKKGGTSPKSVRFWVPLEETRNIEFEGQ